MDVELLARMIGELVVDHDQVGLPGVGTFVAEVVPATFSDRGYTINPPYRRLSFHPSRTEDNLLVDFYAASNGISVDASRAYVTRFLAELKTVLKEKKTIVLPGLGRLRATLENNFFFVPDENLDIYPDGFALKPVSLKTHGNIEEPAEIPSVFPLNVPVSDSEPEAEPQQESPAEPLPEPETATAPLQQEEDKAGDIREEQACQESVAKADASLPESAEGESAVVQQETPAVVRDDAAPSPEPETAVPVAEEEEPVRKSRWWVIPVVLLVLCIIGILGFLVLADIAPDFIDSILYTPEELRIINY